MIVTSQMYKDLRKMSVERNRKEDSGSSSAEESYSDDPPKKSPRKMVPKRPTGKSNFTMIVKPDCMSQGKGIFLTRNVDDILANEVCVV